MKVVVIPTTSADTADKPGKAYCKVNDWPFE